MKVFVINLPKEVEEAKAHSHFLEAIGRTQIHISYFAKRLLTNKYPELKEFISSEKTKDVIIFKLLYLSGIIEKKEFDGLNKLRIKRNDLSHKLTSINEYNTKEIKDLIDFGLKLYNKLSQLT